MEGGSFLEIAYVIFFINRNLGFSVSQVQKIPNFAYQIYQTLQIYLVYEKDYIKYKYDRK